MVLSFIKTAKCREKEAYVVLDATLKPLVTSLFKVVTGGRVFHQGFIYVVLSILRSTQSS